MPSLKSSLAVAGAFAVKAYAHGLVSGFNTDGTYNQGFILDYYYAKINTGTYPATAGWYEEATDNGFVAPTSYAEADIICHKNAENANTTASVKAGGTVDFFWTTWPDSHFGPILTYVANCGTGADACSTVDKTTLEWVKIDEAAIDLSTQAWPTADLIANNNSWTVTVPSTLATGSYVFRHEIIAMHGAGSEGGAQNYPFCMNIAITGGGSDSPSGTLGTALYTPTDPGILFNPYTTLTSYTIPGPALFSGGTDSTGGSSGSGSSPSATASSGSSTSATASATATSPATAIATGSGSGSGATSTSSAPVVSATGSTGSGCGAAARRRRRHARQLEASN